MKTALQSPWLTVALAIVVMTIGYVFYMNQNGSIASASGYACPAKTICDSSECLSNGCGNEACKHCPGCQNKAS